MDVFAVVAYVGNDVQFVAKLIGDDSEEFRKAVYDLTAENCESEIYYDIVCDLEDTQVSRTENGIYFYKEL